MGAFADVEKKYGLTIHFTETGSAQDALNAMLGGSADMSVASLANFLKVQAAGKNVVATFAPFIGGGGVLIAPKKYEQERGTDLSKYADGTWGYTREGSVSQLLMKLAAEHAGLKWDDLKKVAFGQPSAGLPLLEAGRIDVAAVDPTTAGQAIDSNVAYLALNFNDPKTAGPIIGEQLGTVYGFNKSFVDKYPEVAKALVGALSEGLDAVNKVANDPAAVLALFPPDIRAALNSGWAQAWPLSAPGVTASDGSMPPKAVADTLSFSQSAGLLTPQEAATASTVVNNSFLP
jgi:ABC-type nitrate/sulfonate/bicarbonate transport system substrate-binding protein